MAERKGFILVAAVLLLSSAAPAAAQKRLRTNCDASQDNAVKCFVQHAVKTGLLSRPADLNSTDFAAYGVSVSKVVQTPDAMVFLLGTMAAVADTMPPLNSDGSTLNQSAQDGAVRAIVDSALRTGLITLPGGASLDQVLRLARDLVSSLAEYKGVTLKPGMAMRFLDSILVAGTASGGSVDWMKVEGSIAALVDSLAAAGVLALPPHLTTGHVKQFALDVTGVIYNYKLATQRSRL